MIGRVIGGYRVLEMVGQGSNGTVWKAEQPELKKQVAIKFLPPDLTHKPADRERFMRGARAVARLNHPGIATVFAADFAGDAPYIVSEFVSGETVAARSARGPLPVAQAVELVLQAARALRYAHQEGVVHRDISGGNIMVTPEGRAKIVDFGMAIERDETRVTTQGTVLGTIAYMAPEVLRGDSADASRDTYALGIILYQLLTGRLPFTADTTEAMVYQILTRHAKPPSTYVPGLPAPLDRVVLHALDKSPKLRCTLERLIAVLETLQESGVVRGGERTRTIRVPIGAGALEAIQRFRRRLTTMSPTQARKLATTVTVSLATIGLLGWAVSRVLPQGPVRPKVASLAILPFFNESPDGGFEYIGHGLAEHLAGRLEGLEGLLVQPYRWTLSGDAEELTAQLNVEGVLEGSFSVRGGNVETRVDLVRRDGKRETIARETSKGYKRAAEELAEAVAKGLKSRLTSNEVTNVGQPATASNEAFDALSTAVDAYHRGNHDESLRWYERAVSMDPGLARAYVGIGSIHNDRYFHCAAGARDLDLAESNFRQALALEPDNGGAERGLILVYSDFGKRDSLLAIAQRAATNASAMDRLLIPAWAYTLGSMPELAVPLLKQAIERDPFNEEALWFLVLASAWTGLYEETVRAGDEYFRKFADDSEMHLWVGAAHWQLGHTAAAKIHFQQALDKFGADTQLYVSATAGLFFQEAGQRTEARRVWSEGLRIAERRRATAPDNIRLRSTLCELYLRLGRSTEVLKEVAYLDSVLASGRPVGEAAASWTIAGYSIPEWRSLSVAFARDSAGPRNMCWPNLDAGVYLGYSKDILNAPELAPMFAEARAYDDSLRQKYGLPPRKSSASL